MHKIMTAASVCLLVAGLSGCYDKAKNTNKPDGPLKMNEDGFTYVLTCVEGREFVATQADWQYWTLAGPLGECN